MNLHKPRKPQVRTIELKKIDDVEGFVLQQIREYFQYLSPEALRSERAVEAITRAVQRRVLEQGCSLQGFSAGFVSDVLHEARRDRALVEMDGFWYPANGGLSAVIVRNEASAVLWLNGLLSKGAKRLDEIDPLWKQESLRGNYKGHRKLQELLDDFFMKNPDGSYRVPDDHERQNLKGRDDERRLRECQQYINGKLNRELEIEEIFAWIELLTARQDWVKILSLRIALTATPGWIEAPGGKDAQKRLRLAETMSKQQKPDLSQASQAKQLKLF